MPLYVVKVGRSTGIFETWAEARIQIQGYPGARFKKFHDFPSAEAYFNSPLDCLSQVLQQEPNFVCR
jgi:ribonuclease HI